MINRLDTLGVRIVLTALAVALVAVATICVGVLVVGSHIFQGLMVGSGVQSADAEDMWRSSVVEVFAGAAGLAGMLSVGLGVFLAWRISRPLERLRTAARQVAGGDYRARVGPMGPRELVSVSESFNVMAEALQMQEEERAELVANFAHELRTPLTNLRGYLEAMRDGVMAPSVDVFESLREEVDRLERLSRSLDVLSGTGGRAAEEPVAFDLALAVHAAVELARPGFERAGLRLTVDTPPPGWLRARVVPDHLSQVLINLLQNAQRYTPQGGVVAVQGRAEAGHVLVAISNAGAQIPPGDLPHVFERFYRVDKSRDRARGGAGIGLAIVKQLVERAGGRVGAESVPGVTRFWFSLPSA